MLCSKFFRKNGALRLLGTERHVGEVTCTCKLQNRSKTNPNYLAGKITDENSFISTAGYRKNHKTMKHYMTKFNAKTSHSRVHLLM